MDRRGRRCRRHAVDVDDVNAHAATGCRVADNVSGNRAYGVNATIDARFSQGVPQQISIIFSDPPTLRP
ncbi:hypothetical protein GCM10009677_54400 [Sphaerisporangium rubeum]|uniref:Uncharacterized protein n=1 Tax=Sphaerisporangium rubeum TaxID=321317 RepID=A0A7X0I9L1_9ACTN|nr:hypothetical protein [Sphaerisporangium rubeum]MBB6470993.1 hypothetical protein [Sphaerisporangium rubeum]